METTTAIYILAILTCTGLFYRFFCLTSKAQERLEAIKNGKVTGKHETFFGRYITVNNITFRTSQKVYSQLAVGMTFPLNK